MQKIYLVVTALFLSAIVTAQTSEITRDNEGNKVVKGFLTKKDFVTDTSFAWFAKNQAGYVPDAIALRELKADKDSVHILAFGGTWCSDTRFILPKFFVLADAAGVPQDNITVLGVDHDKKTIQHLAEAFNITNVPTIIVFKNGKEIGRVVEFGKHGMFDQDIAEILGGKAN